MLCFHEIERIFSCFQNRFRYSVRKGIFSIAIACRMKYNRDIRLPPLTCHYDRTILGADKVPGQNRKKWNP